jgi:hypothetical protein
MLKRKKEKNKNNIFMFLCKGAIKCTKLLKKVRHAPSIAFFSLNILRKCLFLTFIKSVTSIGIYPEFSRDFYLYYSIYLLEKYNNIEILLL